MDIIKSFGHEKKALQKSSKSNDQIKFTEHKKYRNKLNCLIYSTKSNYCNNLTIESGNQIDKLWNIEKINQLQINQ